MSRNQPRAIVIGGSIGGLAAAVLLRRRGWDVNVFERSDVELRGRGAGIVTHQELIDVLAEAGADTADLGIHIGDRTALDATGAAILNLERPQIVTSWDRLQQAFRMVFPPDCYHLGRALTRVEQDAEGVTAYFADGSHARADMLVAADGFRSALRRQYAPEVQPIYAGYVIWRGVADEANIPAAAHASVFDRFAFFTAPGQELIGYPIPGPENDLRPGHLRYNWVWYRTTTEARLNESLRDVNGTQHTLTIPPPLIRDDIVAEMRASARRFAAPQFVDILDAIPNPFFTPIYDYASDQIVFGRAVLVGDSAFLARPHVGLGVTKAAGDAAALARAIDACAPDLTAGLARYQEERTRIGRRCVARARELGEFLNPAPGIVHDHMALLRDTADDAFLREKMPA